MIVVGEEMVNLDTMLIEGRGLLRGRGGCGGQGADVDPRAGRMMILSAGITGFIVIVMYMPMFKVVTT